MSNIKVLYDLTLGHAKMGFSGIPQDTRLLFAGLADSLKINLSGLIRASASNVYFAKKLESLLEQSLFLGPFINDEINQLSIIARLVEKFFGNKAARAFQLFFSLKRDFSKLYPVHKDLGDILWRAYFASTIEPSRKENILAKNYELSRLGDHHILVASLYNFSRPSIDTRKYDFFITQDSRAVQVHPKTKKIVRYHDGLPVFASDTFLSDLHCKAHVASILKCTDNSIYVCNSPSALNELGKISPKAAETARVIPYFVPKMAPAKIHPQGLKEIACLRLSPHTIKPGNEKKLIKTWFGKEASIPTYIMSLATIEPRKNYIGLIRAWQKLRQITGQDIKLMIVGRPGWKFAPTLTAIKPFVELGTLLHLENVSQIELPYLYSSAACFVFPSFAEGFGLPPIEAMQCHCPVALSDIPAHRYAAGDAALFFNPYDIDDIVLAMKTLTSPDSPSSLRESLIAKGITNTARFNKEAVLPQWETLFEELSD